VYVRSRASCSNWTRKNLKEAAHIEQQTGVKHQLSHVEEIYPKEMVKAAFAEEQRSVQKGEDSTTETADRSGKAAEDNGQQGDLPRAFPSASSFRSISSDLSSMSSMSSRSSRSPLWAQEKVIEWCKRHGYQDVNTWKRTKNCGAKFPLHTAVKHRNEIMVDLLLKFGAEPNVVDSRNTTPRQLADRLNSNGKWDQIVDLLR